ncbi:MAG: methylated-DNA--[protein]-cysteine S-methyltransferase [Thermoleophilaceae bacterium]
MNDLTAGPPAALLDRVAQRAAREGLLDVAYAQVDSPLGPLTVAATERGLVHLAYPEHSVDGVLERLSQEVSPRVLEAPARLDGIRRELGAYFVGELQRFETPIDWSLTRGFYRQVLQATARIGFGEVGTYTTVAAAAGNAKAVRAAGSGLGSNPIPVVVPCHRVLRTDGALGGYTGGLERKRFLLELER